MKKKPEKKLDKRIVLSALRARADTPLTAEEIAEMKAAKPRAVRRTLTRLKLAGEVTRHYLEKRYVYTLAGWVESDEQIRLRIDGNSRRTPEGCIVWLGAPHPNASGPELWIHGKTKGVRRWLYEKRHGPLTSKFVVRMSCDTEGCICEDCMVKVGAASWMKGRPMPIDVRIKNARSKGSKTTAEQKADILYGPGTQRERAERNGISQCRVSSMTRNPIMKIMAAGGAMFGGLVA